MGKVINRSASTTRIKETVLRALNNARARGGEIQALTEARLGESATALETNEVQLNQARAKDDTLHAALMARDEESDLEIKAVCDEMWNALGRPAQSVDYDILVAGGAKVWTDGDPASQPHLMAVLATNIRNTRHPKLVERKDGWAGRIDQKAAAQAEAAAPTAAAYAQVAALGMQRRTLADTAQVGMSRLKRDLKNLGMTEAQIHEIIPDVPSANGASSVVPAPAPKPA
jgi:hypothetical protein